MRSIRAVWMRLFSTQVNFDHPLRLLFSMQLLKFQSTAMLIIRRVLMRLVAATVGLVVAGLCVANPATASINKKKLNVPPEALRIALQEFSSASGLQVLFILEDVGTRHTDGVVGEFTPDEALHQLLKGTGLTFSYLDHKTVTIMPAGTVSDPPASSADHTSTTLSGVSGEGSSDRAADSSPWKNFRLAEADTTSSVESKGSESGTAALQEVIVTAEKRAERLQDVPVAMTVLDPQTLAENGKNRLLDYFGTVPGLSVAGQGYIPGTTYITIRGLSTGQGTNSTTAVVVDDVPTGSGSQLVYGGQTAPDLDPSDLVRIEVLKGPQGTLYGADSLGGLVKYVTVDPSTSGYSGRVEVAGAGVLDGGLGYAVRGAVNVPVTDNFAVRVSGFDRRDPGYTKDIFTGQTNVNTADVYGGHMTALWNISEAVSLKVGALIQQSDVHGLSRFNAQLAPYGTVQASQGYLNYTSEPFGNSSTTQEQLYSATLKAKMDGMELVSASGYSLNKLYAVRDQGNNLDSFYENATNPIVTGIAQRESFQTNTFSQELRLSSSAGHWLDWLVGGFYMHQSSPGSHNYQDNENYDPVTGVIEPDLDFVMEGPFTLNEYATFADATTHFTDRFDLQVGGRQSWNDQQLYERHFGPSVTNFGVPNPYIPTIPRATGNAFTYLVTPPIQVGA